MFASVLKSKDCVEFAFTVMLLVLNAPGIPLAESEKTAFLPVLARV